MSIELFLDYISQPARAVLTICKIGNISLKINEKRVFKNEHTDESVLKLNPLWTIPFIIDHENNGFRLTESHAIMKYLINSRKNKFPKNLYPNDPKSAGRVDEFLDWHHQNTRKTAFYILNKRLPNASMVSGLNKEKLEIDFEDSMATLNDYFLKEKKFIGGLDEFSIADISGFFELFQLTMIEYDFTKYRNISEWMKKMYENKYIQDANKEFIVVLQRVLKQKEIKPKF